MMRRSRPIATFTTGVLFTCLAITITFAATKPRASSEAQTERYFESIRKDPNLLVAFLLEMPKGEICTIICRAPSTPRP